MSKTVREEEAIDLFGPDEEEAEPDLSHISEGLRPLARPITDLIADPANARRHNERNLNVLAASIRSFQQVKNIVVQRKPDGALVVRAGNGTLQAALALGWTHVAAEIKDWDDVTATAFAIADNRSAELAEWDDQVLPQILEVLQADGADLMAAVGFSDEDISGLLETFQSTSLSFLEQFGDGGSESTGSGEGAGPANLPQGSSKVILAFQVEPDDRDTIVRWLQDRAKEDGLGTISEALAAFANDEE